MSIVAAGFVHNVTVYARRLNMRELDAGRIERMAAAVEAHSGLSQDSRSGAVFGVVGSHLHQVCPNLPVKDVVTVSRIVAGAYWYYRKVTDGDSVAYDAWVDAATTDVMDIGFSQAQSFSGVAKTYLIHLVEGRRRDERSNASLPASQLAHAILCKLPEFNQVQHGDDLSEENFF